MTSPNQHENPTGSAPGAGTGAGAGGYGPAGAQQPPQQPPQPPQGHEFFQSIRHIGLRRGTNRWVGGVCSGVAQRLGWDPLLIRIIWFALCFFGGAGIALYGVAWLLLPDERDGSILVEEVTFGHVTPGFILSILMVVGGVTGSTATIPFIGVGLIIAIALIVVASAILSGQNSHGRNTEYPMGTNTGSGTESATTYGLAATGHPTGNAYGTRTGTGQPQGSAPQQPGAAAPQSTLNFQQSPGAQKSSTGQPPLTQPWTTQPPTPVNDKAWAAAAVRKPAHPAVISVIYGLLFLSAAAIAALAFLLPNNVGFNGWQLFVIWALVADLIVGVSLIGLGIAGRRSASVGWMVAPLLIISLFAIPQWGARNTTTLQPSASTIVMSSASYTSKDFSTIAPGIDAVMASVDIDLSDWQDSSASNGTSCPTGTLNLEARFSSVTITLPRGCGWSVGELVPMASSIDADGAESGLNSHESTDESEILSIAGSSLLGSIDIEE
ncbi:MAG: PspC domain-containing protein [Bifidobacteriaceae bacterium]|nr:PspC domain-containing protein [Bifidobacteriaceae bacterium]MCI1979186.1 PspC domain-containing protein [Bifidobacteriaceae bacterium]